jgi:hypothetical protein
MLDEAIWETGVYGCGEGGKTESASLYEVESYSQFYAAGILETRVKSMDRGMWSYERIVAGSMRLSKIDVGEGRGTK